MNELLIDRLKNARISNGLKQQDVAERLGIKANTISNWEKGRTEPDIDSFVKLCDIYQIDCASLLSDVYAFERIGTDITLLEYDNIKKYRDLDDHGREHVDIVLEWETDRIQSFKKLGNRPIITLAEYEASKAPTYLIPYWENGVSAGNGIYQLNDTNSVMINLWATELTRQVDFIIKVSGHSMEPDYHDGDKVLVSRDEVVMTGEVGIFVKNGDTFIKELGEGELISRNPEYDNIAIHDLDNVVCMGKVIGILKDDMIAND